MSGPADLVRVLHEDKYFMVFYKPPGIPTTSPDASPSLVQVAKHINRNASLLHPSSRLDADVSGLVTFARTRPAIQHLLDARKNGRYFRCYIGLARGVFENDAGSFTSNIARDPADARKRLALSEDDEGIDVKTALTDFRVIEKNRYATALHLFPRTGRTHQLRVHLADATFPLLGDHHYGGPKRLTLSDGRMVSARRVMLHCARVTIPRMHGEGTLTFTCDVDDDMRKAWRDLGGHDKKLIATDE